MGVLYNVHISDHSSPHSPLPLGACHSPLSVWTVMGGSFTTGLPHFCPCPLTSIICTACKSSPFHCKSVRVTPVHQANLYTQKSQSSLSVIQGPLYLHHHSPCPITHIHTSQMLFPATSTHALCSGTLASLLNLKRAHHSSASGPLLKCLHLSGIYILRGIG